MSLSWSEPPTEVIEQERKSRLKELASELKENPGKWAMFDRTWDDEVTARVYASGIRTAKSEAWAPKGTFEAVAGTHPEKDGYFAVWLRFVGEDGPTIDAD